MIIMINRGEKKINMMIRGKNIRMDKKVPKKIMKIIIKDKMIIMHKGAKEAKEMRKKRRRKKTTSPNTPMNKINNLMKLLKKKED